MKKIAIIILASFIVLAGFWFFDKNSAVAPIKKVVQESIKIEIPKPVTITFVGDTMFDRGVRNSIEKNFSGDYNSLFVNTDYLKDSDIAFANLEGPVALGGHKVGSRFSFRMDPKGILALKEAGFDIVSFANNHVGDYTRVAFDETLGHLSDAGILYTGAGKNLADTTEPRILEIRGLKVGFLGATDVGPEWMKATSSDSGVLLANNPNILEIIKQAKTKVDILVVSFHWGQEYSPANSHQEELAHSVIDAGADIVVGHHPHVMQRVEIYNEKPIFYSLGNFIFDQYFSINTMKGMVAQVSIDPVTKKITATEQINTLSRAFIPQELKPFSQSDLITKTFKP